MEEKKDKNLLIEYQATKNSAQHHDSLLWTTTGIIWGANLLLFDFVIQNFGKTEIRMYLEIICILSIFLLLFQWMMALQFRSVRNQKYSRCKEIEKIFGFEQHSKLIYKNGIMQIFYATITITYICLWIFLFSNFFIN